MNQNGKIKAISISNKKGIPKTNVPIAEFRENWGIEGDAHAGKWHRQVSLLAFESMEKVNETGLISVSPGDFAENIMTENINILNLNIGDRLKLGSDVVLEVTQIGKECHTKCAIYQAVGDCVMPKEGLFAKVLRGGFLKVNDPIEFLEERND